MKVEQSVYEGVEEKKTINSEGIGSCAQMVLLFGSKSMFLNNAIIEEIRNDYPNACLMGCTTAGEIFDSQVVDDTLTVTALFLEKSQVLFSSLNYKNSEECYETAKRIASEFPKDGLKHVFILCEGVNTNGSQIVNGFKDFLPENVSVTGGLSGDGDRFIETLVMCNDNISSNKIVAAAFYGENFRVGYASGGGWDNFGIERIVNKSKGNVLYELDGRPALDIYKEYLGDYSKNLPSSGLLFPLCIRSADSKYEYVRTILAVNEKEKTLTFAGDVPQGCYAKLMKANFDNLVSGSMLAAELSLDEIGVIEPSLAILISCVGRKLVLRQLIDEEIEVAKDVFGSKTVLTGFYSYGEISPYQKGVECNLHNQTMTITLFGEE